MAVHRWPHSLAALHHRDFRVLWVGTFVSNAGSWMQKVATGWLIYQMTGSAAWLGIDAFASGIPTVLLLPFGGVLSDRVSRRALLIGTNALSATLAFVLAGLQAGHILAVWHIVLISALSGVIQAGMVPASTSLLPALVGDADVPNAIALNSMQFNLSRVVGPAVGGLSLVYWGAAWSFALNGASFLVLVGAFFLIRRVPPVHAARESFAKSLTAGLGFIRQRADVSILLALVFLTAFLGSPVVSMLPALVKATFHRGATSYSLLLSAFGAGAVLAAVLIAAFDRGNWSRTLNFVALAALGLTEAALAFTGQFWLGVALVSCAGTFFVGTMVRLGTALIQSIPDEFRGRVSAFQQLLFRSGQPMGALFAGIIARQLGIRMSFSIFGGILAICMAGLLIRQRCRSPHRT